jgi:hypothetical protein
VDPLITPTLKVFTHQLLTALIMCHHKVTQEETLQLGRAPDLVVLPYSKTDLPSILNYLMPGGLTCATVVDGGLRRGSSRAGCGGGEVRAGAGVRLCGGGDAARRGEVGALPCQCSLLLGGAPVAAVMKGSRRLRQRGPSTGAAAVVTMGSQRRQRVLQSLP